MPERLETPTETPRVLSTIERAVLEADIIEALRSIFDPEIPVNIYDLGLIYDIQIDDERKVNVVMTLTSPACPVAESLPGDVQRVIQQVATVKRADVELSWDPPFSIDRMSEDVKLMLGLM